MATYTSSQSGNFSASSTWGGSGVPGDGDRFDVTYGHTVTIDTGISIPTNGYADSYVYGILQSQSGANTTLRMNGRLYIKGGTGYESLGLLHLRDGATIQINGTSADRHGVWVENEDGASFIFEGSDGMPSTTLTANETEGSTSLAVTSGTNFATGEWIAVFDNATNYTAENDNHVEQNQDEGFWIHEVDGNTIYFRIFGGPDDVTISSVSTVNDTDITVSNAKVFREGQKIIFGTGTNRNVKTISNIFYDQNIIRCDSTVDNSPSVVGQTVYLTGTEKKHGGTTTKVRKVATVTTAESASGANTITVANSNMFTADDEIWIEMRSEAAGSTDYEGRFDYNSYARAGWFRHVVQSVDGNTITLTANSNYKVVEGALVSRMTRNIVIETVATDGSDYGFFYAEHRNDFNRKGIAKDVYFRNVGNDDSNTEAGFVLRGRWSTDNLAVTLSEQVPSVTRAPWIEGITIYAYPENTHRRDWGPLWLYDARYAKARCCIAMNGEDGLCSYYEPGTSIVNCISVAARERGCRLEGSTETFEWAYNYVSRTYWGGRIIIPYEMGLGFHDNIFDAGVYGLQLINSEVGPNLFRCRISGFRYGLQNNDCGMDLVYSHVKPLSGYVNVDADTGTTQAANAYSNRMFRSLGILPLRSIEHNYEIDAFRIYGYNYEAKWDNVERAWRFFRRYDNDNDPALGQRIFIPAHTTVNVSAYVKLAPSFSGTYPYLAARDNISPVSENRIGNDGGADSSMWAGKRYTAQYTSAAASAYEQKTLTIASKPYPRQYYIAVYSSNRNASEGYWIKDFFIFIDKAYQISPFNTLNDKNLFSPVTASVGINTFAKPTMRLGGRIF